MTNNYQKNHEFFTRYANSYADDRFRKVSLDTKMSNAMCDFLTDATLDQLYDACLFVNEKQMDYCYGGTKTAPAPDAEMEEVYNIMLKHFYVNLRNRLYQIDKTTSRQFFNLMVDEQHNVAHAIHDLQKTYTECYGWQSGTTDTADQRSLQRELTTYQNKASLLQQIMAHAPKTQGQNQDQGREQ